MPGLAQAVAVTVSTEVQAAASNVAPATTADRSAERSNSEEQDETLPRAQTTALTESNESRPPAGCSAVEGASAVPKALASLLRRSFPVASMRQNATQSLALRQEPLPRWNQAPNHGSQRTQSPADGCFGPSENHATAKLLPRCRPATYSRSRLVAKARPHDLRWFVGPPSEKQACQVHVRNAPRRSGECQQGHAPVAAGRGNRAEAAEC